MTTADITVGSGLPLHHWIFPSFSHEQWLYLWLSDLPLILDWVCNFKALLVQNQNSPIYILKNTS
jgi:hypothetical protein